MRHIQGSFLRLVTKALEDDGLPRHLLCQFPLQYSASRSQEQPQPVSSVKPFSVVHVELEMVRHWEQGAQPLYSSTKGSCKDVFGRCAMAGSQPFEKHNAGTNIPTSAYALTSPSHHELHSYKLEGQSSTFHLVAMVTTGIFYCQGS